MSNNINISVAQQLQKFNLDKEEALVYVALLQLGEASIIELAAQTELKRPSVYNYVDSLVKKGFARWESEAKGKVVASDPHVLSLALEKEREKLDSMNSAYHGLIDNLHTLQTRKDFSTQVRYYQGVSGLRKIALNSLRAKDAIYGYSYFGRNEVLGEEFMKDFRQKWVDSNLKDHVIVNNDTINKDFPKKVMVEEYLHRMQCRFLPKETFYISSDIMIYNNVYAVSNLQKDNPMGIEIYNEEIAKTQLSIFKVLWNLVKPIKWKI